MRLALKPAAGIPAVVTYYAAVVYGPCMMSVLLGHAWQDEHSKRRILTEAEEKNKKKNTKQKQRKVTETMM